jgi:hypothetical protein
MCGSFKVKASPKECEHRLLIVEAGANEGEGILSLLVGREIVRLCPTNRIGSLAKAPLFRQMTTQRSCWLGYPEA